MKRVMRTCSSFMSDNRVYYRETDQDCTHGWNADSFFGSI